jgi:hypothetical protein
MKSASGFEGRGKVPWWRRHPVVIVSAVSVGVVVIWLALPSPWGMGGFQSLSQQSKTTLGPFTLDSTTWVSFSFPQCAFVVAHWAVVTGGPTNFSVGQPEVVLVSNCHGPPPSNETCPPWMCGQVSMGPGPVCFETGMGGTCSFTATQPQYSFNLLQALAGGAGPVPAGESATLTIDFS